MAFLRVLLFILDSMNASLVRSIRQIPYEVVMSQNTHGVDKAIYHELKRNVKIRDDEKSGDETMMYDTEGALIQNKPHSKFCFSKTNQPT